jgi:hypothetical protein
MNNTDKPVIPIDDDNIANIEVPGTALARDQARRRFQMSRC